MNLLDVVKSNDFLVLDTETTGLDRFAEICQIAIINQDGNVLLDTLVKPTQPIPSDAMRIHGITNEMVADQPSWVKVSALVYTIIKDTQVIIYNADYDTRLMVQSSSRVSLNPDWVKSATYHCAMLPFAKIYGDWNSYHGNYKWKPLSTAAAYYNVPVIDAHNALADCQMTLGVVKGMLNGVTNETD